MKVQGNVFKKCEELGFDPNRGEIKLSESFINLTQSKDILIDAIEKEKLNQLPLSIQRNLLVNIETIASSITNLMAGTDEVINLSNSIEQLYVSLWQYNIYNISDELLGYLKKMNQLKYQITRVKELEKELEVGLALKVELGELLNSFKTSANEVTTILTNSNANNLLIKENAEKNTELNNKVSAIVSSIEQNEKVSKDLIAQSKTSESEIKAIEERIKTFNNEIDNYKSTISNTSEGAKQAIESNKEQTREIIDELKTLENQIKDQIEKATGYSLFHSFQTRQGAISASKGKWLYILGVLILLTLGLTAFIAYSHDSFDVAFYLKLSMSIPLIYAITFCTVQYNKERRLEEEYAFKSNISISLIPYQELVKKVVLDTPEEHTKYTAFLIDSISKVFTSPTEYLHDHDEGKIHNSDKALKQLSKTLESVLKPFEPIIKMIK